MYTNEFKRNMIILNYWNSSKSIAFIFFYKVIYFAIEVQKIRNFAK